MRICIRKPIHPNRGKSTQNIIARILSNWCIWRSTLIFLQCSRPSLRWGNMFGIDRKWSNIIARLKNLTQCPWLRVKPESNFYNEHYHCSNKIRIWYSLTSAKTKGIAWHPYYKKYRHIILCWRKAKYLTL